MSDGAPAAPGELDADPRAARRRGLRAPREAGGVLIDPPLPEAAALVVRNAAALASSGVRLFDVPLARFIQQARQELLSAALAASRAYRDVTVPQTSRVVLAGHQPELFHAGVWFKHFVLAGLAARAGAVPVNLVIDGDLAARVGVPVLAGSRESPCRQLLPLDGEFPAVPYEERPLVDRATFEGFASRAAACLAPFVHEPLVGELWPLVVARGRATGRLGAALAEGRHQLEGRWGLETLEIRQSQVCELPVARWFLVELAARAERFREVYNAAIGAYRRANHVRSRTHPAPELEASDGQLELPYWVWTAADPRRRRLFVERAAGRVALVDRAGWRLELPAGFDDRPEGAVERLAAAAAAGVRLRTRALATTLLARLALGDLFVHGLGGGKYDAVTDAIFRGYYGLEPPEYLVATATLPLPVAGGPPTDRDPAAWRRRLRQLRFEPERFVDPGAVPPADRPAVAEAVNELRRLWAGNRAGVNASTDAGAARHARCLALRAALGPWVAPQVEAALAGLASAERGAAAAALVESRAWAYCWHPAEPLREKVLAFAARSA